MNRTFTFKVDSTIPQLDAIIEDIMDDFSVARKSRRLHIDTDYLPVVVMLDPDHKPERWAPQNHNWRVEGTCPMYRRFGKYTDIHGDNGVVVDAG